MTSALSGGRHAIVALVARFVTTDIPEAIRQLAANGAEVLVRVSAYMDPWVHRADGLVDIVNRCRALENTAYVVAAIRVRA